MNPRKILFLNWQFPFSNKSHAICFTNLFYRLIKHDTEKKIEFHSLSFNVLPGDLEEHKSHYNKFKSDYGNRVKEKSFVRFSKRNSFINSFYEILKANFEVRKYVKQENIDTIFIYSDTALFLIFFSLDLKVKLIFDCKGDMISEEKYRGGGFLKINLYKIFYRILIPRFDKIFVSSTKLIDLFVRYNTKAKFSTNANYYDNDHIYLKSNRNNQKGITFVYCGNTAKYQLLEDSLQLFREYHKVHPDSNLLLIIPGNHEYVFSLIEKFKVNKNVVRLISAKNSYEVNDYLNEGDIALMLRENDPVNYYSFPTKFSEYLAAGLPIISTEYVYDTAWIINDNTLGVMIDMKEDISVNIKRIENFLISNKDINIRCSEYAKKYLSWSSNISRIYDEILTE